MANTNEPKCINFYIWHMKSNTEQQNENRRKKAVKIEKKNQRKHRMKNKTYTKSKENKKHK